jgi:hypothetical protein
LKLPQLYAERLEAGVLPCFSCRPASPSADDAVLRGYQGNTVLQRFKLTGKAALITGEHVQLMW